MSARSVRLQALLPEHKAGAHQDGGSTSQPALDPSKQPWPKQAIEAASHGAIAFCQIYYEAFDEPSRRAKEIPLMYMPDAKVIWNGNAVPPDTPGMSAFLDALPLSRHDLQSLDCHPLPAPPSVGSAPDLIVDITGSVLHGPSIANSFSNDAREPPAKDKPRKFHEMLVLRAAEQGEGMQPKYKIFTQNFRFIG